MTFPVKNRIFLDFASVFLASLTANSDTILSRFESNIDEIAQNNPYVCVCLKSLRGTLPESSDRASDIVGVVTGELGRQLSVTF